MSTQSAVVFAFESEEFGNQGQRKYLVTTYYHFSMKYLWVYTCTYALPHNSMCKLPDKHRAMKPPRHFYEVISEGGNFPYEIAACRVWSIAVGAVCRLYFDIEFNLGVNPHTPPISVLNTFIEVCRSKLLNRLLQAFCVIYCTVCVLPTECELQIEVWS